MIRKIYALIFTLIFSVIGLASVYAQGCVAIRGFAGCNGQVGSDSFLPKGEWLVNGNFRYFHSFRHFRGEEEETNRVEEGTEVINDSYFFDVSVSYGISDRWYGTLVLPLVYHERSSMYEHGGNPPNGLGDRHKTFSSGLGDVRMSASYWVMNPVKNPKGNLSVGLGMKFPTGDYGATDSFYNQGENRDETLELTVDQSIQPGDGGFGATLELQAYRMLSHHFMLNGNFFYLANPRETNGESARNRGTEFSVPDQYAIRAGATYVSSVPGLSFYLGGRHECIPVYDLIGGSDGFRRPGYVTSIEPGVNYGKGAFAVNVNVPVALKRNRTRSYLDIEGSTPDNYRHGDAAFADYLINIGFAWKISKKVSEPFHTM
ncbi:transporter [Echinicola sp. CAU 1574]|uniref:Transporter n=1 Tax=Echinicola arenosa TaxID=2774144 RepID=A0ABR9AI38_9BACT|nr:transporter [Echinicola arenosa]MBD8488458.1 transporter [Echinicola arenosa]